MSQRHRFIASLGLAVVATFAGSPLLAQFNCPGTLMALGDATSVSGSGGTCYRFPVPEESPFIRLQVSAGSPLDLYVSMGIQDELTDLDRLNPNPVEGDAKFVLLEPTQGDYTVAVAPQAGSGFSLEATAAALPENSEPLTVCNGGICSTAMPMMKAAQAVELGSTFGDRVIFPVTVDGPGAIRVEASWSGSAERLALILNGPRRPELRNPVAYYAREDGGSPLTLTYSITTEDAERGQRFYVSLVNFSGGEALGDVEISRPRTFRLNTFRGVTRLAAPSTVTRVQRLQVSCASRIQNRIAWDYEGNKRWADGNIQRLCRGAETSAEPATCFQRVMHGGVNWGGGTRWQWQNAIDLCEGTTDAARTIACFQRRIRAGEQWSAAIRACETG